MYHILYIKFIFYFKLRRNKTFTYQEYSSNSPINPFHRSRLK